MPPKKRLKEPIQTKLSFKPISASSPATLFTMESATPLRSHMSIINTNEIKPKTNSPASSLGVGMPQQSSSSFISKPSAAAHPNELSQIGGNKNPNGPNGVNGAAKTTTDNAFSTRELASSISSAGYESKSDSVSSSAATTASSPPSAQGVRSATVNGTTFDYMPGYDAPHSAMDLDKNTSSEAPTFSENDERAVGESRKRKATLAMAGSDKVDLGSYSQPVALESDSEDELLQMPKATLKRNTSALSSASDSQPSSSPATPGSLPTTGPKLSLLEQMATPRGTRPLPRTLELMNRKTNVGYSAAAQLASQSQRSSSTPGSGPLGLTLDHPILVSSSSTVSDDGFVSASSLDNRMQGLFGSREPEVTPPLSQNSLNSGSQQSQAKVQSHNQKRSGDFASYSVGGGTKRVLPPTITGYQPVSTFQAGAQMSSKVTMASLSRTPSFAKSQSVDRSRSRSSSPGQSPGVRLNDNASSGQINYQRNMTKDGVLLSDEQQHVLEQVMVNYKNVFFTGSAGTGKSVLLRELIFQLRSRYNNARGKGDFWDSPNDSVAVTASTGIAACNIGGCTLHSFAGVGLGQEALPALQAKIRKNATAVRRWQDTKVLIIDEVSMIDADFMDKLEALARFVRKDDRPWGGIQLVLTGDFFQLPPVNKSGNVKFCFEGGAWSRTVSVTIQLQQVFRQKDQTFADMLNEMRLGQMSPKTIDCFRNLTRNLTTNDGLRPTELFPLRNQVEEANNRMLNNLAGKTVVYRAKDGGVLKEKMEQNCLAPTVLQLKVNAQVMLLRNQAGGAGGLVNGSLGILVGFVTRTADNENVLGAGGDRKGSLNTPGEELPLVRFTIEGGSTREMVVGREEWKIELPNGDIQGSRVQIPLGLAWSLSIHKSQGQTLPKVRVDLGRVFEKGQAYVALSRAVSLDGLQVVNFDPRKVMVHPRVTEFYNKLRVYKKQVEKE